MTVTGHVTGNRPLVFFPAFLRNVIKRLHTLIWVCMSAFRSKLPVNMIDRPYRSLEVQKMTLTYSNFRYPNCPLLGALSIIQAGSLPVILQESLIILRGTGGW